MREGGEGNRAHLVVDVGRGRRLEVDASERLGDEGDDEEVVRVGEEAHARDGHGLEVEPAAGRGERGGARGRCFSDLGPPKIDRGEVWATSTVLKWNSCEVGGRGAGGSIYIRKRRFDFFM